MFANYIQKSETAPPFPPEMTACHLERGEGRFTFLRLWSILVHWAEQAIKQTHLRLRPANDVALLTEALTTLDLAPLQELVNALPPLLDEAGLTLHQKRLTQFITVLGPTYAEARERWWR